MKVRIDASGIARAVASLRPQLIRPSVVRAEIGKARQAIRRDLARRLAPKVGLRTKDTERRILFRRIGGKLNLVVTVGGDEISLSNWRARARKDGTVIARARRGGGTRRLRRAFIVPKAKYTRNLIVQRKGGSVTFPKVDVSLADRMVRTAQFTVRPHLERAAGRIVRRLAGGY